MDVGFNSKIVSCYTETIMSKLSNNTTLQSLVICPDKIAFERNEQTSRMEFIDTKQLKVRHENIDLVPPPAKRPFPLKNVASNSHLSPPPTRSQTPAFSPENWQEHGFEHSPENASSSTVTVQPQAMIQTMASALVPPVQRRQNTDRSSTAITQLDSPYYLGYSGGSDPTHCVVIPLCQTHPQPLTNLLQHGVPYQGQMSYESSSWAQPYLSYFGGPQPQVVTYPTGGTRAHGCTRPMHQQRPMQAQAIASAPVYYENHWPNYQSPWTPDHQNTSVASCTVVTTTSMPSFSTSH